MRRFVLAFVAATLVAGSPAIAAPCKDAKGKFIKCPTAAPAKGARCKDSKGKFIKCGMPGAMPMK